MKQILLGLILTGLVSINAHAQAKYCSKYDQNYRVCRNQNGYTVCGNLPASCNGGSDAVNNNAGNGNVPYAATYPYRTPASNVAHSKYDINYPICMHKDGYAICTEDEAMNQPATYAPDVYLDKAPGKSCGCTEEHNGILVSYNDYTTCAKLQENEQ